MLEKVECTEMSLCVHTDHHVLCERTLAAVVYRDNILYPYVRSYTEDIGDTLIVLDYNAQLLN